MQLGSSVRSGQTSVYCRANQCSAGEGQQLKRVWLSSHSSCISLSQEDGDERGRALNYCDSTIKEISELMHRGIYITIQKVSLRPENGSFVDAEGETRTCNP